MEEDAEEDETGAEEEREEEEEEELLDGRPVEKVAFAGGAVTVTFGR